MQEELNKKEESQKNEFVKQLTQEKYKYGFTTEVHTDIIEKGLNEDVVRLISAKKGEPEWLLEFRLKAYRYWLTMEMPTWAHLNIPEIDYQAISYYADPTKKKEGPKSMDEVDPELIKTFNKLGIPLEEQMALSGMAVDAVMDSVSVKTTFKETLLEKGIIFCSFSEAVREHPDLVKKYYGKLADTAEDGVTAFNTAFAQDGVLFYVPKNVVVEKPIQLVNILRGDVNFMINRRVLVILEEGAQARLLVCDHAMDSVNFLATQVIEIFAGENAVFDFYELEETHTSTVRISNMYVKQEANSNVLLNGMTLHNGTTRNTTRVTLAGEHAELNLCGMAIADKNQHVDNHTTIDHAVPNCTSNELYKYVLDEQAVGAFAGLVLVRPDAQHTSSQQTNRNLCATRDAHMYTQPQLEIYADDVKCSHGATVGQLDESALFYMRQRGIPVREARLLLMFAFVNEVIDTIRLDALKDRLHLLVEKRFRGELNKCQGCAICK